jgi:hypothetical protein
MQIEFAPKMHVLANFLCSTVTFTQIEINLSAPDNV